MLADGSLLFLIPFFPLLGFVVCGLIALVSAPSRLGASRGLVGTIATLISYGLEGGLSDSGGALMGAGLLTLGLFFFFSGLVTVVMAYRMENSRLERVSQELHAALTGGASPVSTTR